MFSVTQRAAERINHVAAKQGNGGSVLRVAVDAGGCSGFQYQFTFIDSPEAEDTVIEESGARVALDPVSLELLSGSELDFVQEMIGAYFAVNNPNAAGSCGCGSSFSI